MKIKSIKIKNFKSLREVEVDTSSFNVFVGQNNHGKTNLFQAIEWFYTGKTDTDSFRHINAVSTDEVSVEIEFSERKLAVILEREAEKWFKPTKGQFQIFYKSGADHLEYQPDFVAETAEHIYMLEPKDRNKLDATDVIAKRDIAVKWCQNATDHAKTYGGKPWSYVLLPLDVIDDNMTLAALAQQFTAK